MDAHINSRRITEVSVGLKALYNPHGNAMDAHINSGKVTEISVGLKALYNPRRNAMNAHINSRRITEVSIRIGPIHVCFLPFMKMSNQACAVLE